jgi:hypothetical protein
LLSPDQDFSIQGAQTHTNYLKVFRTYRDMIIKDGNTPAYKAIFNSFNSSLFGRSHTPISKNIRGGEGESEEELEDYRSRLKNDPPLD